VEAQPLAAPVSLTIASVGIAAPVLELGVSAEGEMEAPPTPDVVGWYRMSARPGQPGNSVLSGHVDWARNTAVFWGLRKLHKGDPIVVGGADGANHTYIVEWNESFPWQTAPVNRIVGPSADSLLTLITCEGVYDKRSQQYSERRVVRARLAD
jgi:sortase (surface protein transpeptidase)